MTQVNRPAVGFLNMVDAQQMGRTPALIADTVVPNVDMFPFWTSEVMQSVSNRGANLVAPANAAARIILGVDPNLGTSVPLQLWMPLRLSFSFEWVNGASGSVDADVLIRGLESNPVLPTRLATFSDNAYFASMPADQRFTLTYQWTQREFYRGGRGLTIDVDVTTLNRGPGVDGVLTTPDLVLQYLRIA